MKELGKSDVYDRGYWGVIDSYGNAAKNVDKISDKQIETLGLMLKNILENNEDEYPERLILGLKNTLYVVFSDRIFAVDENGATKQI